MKFTGHERDLNSPAGAGDDLDYMHARHCSPVTGRFLGVDPAGESIDPQTPQSWNRYTYVRGNPLGFTDPTGKVLVFRGSSQQYRQLEEIANKGLNGFRLIIDKKGRTETLLRLSSMGHSLKLKAMLSIVCCSLFISSCNKPEVSPREKINTEWKRHEAVISAAISDEGFYEDQYYQAVKFFDTLTGIKIRSQTTYDGLMPDRDAKKGLDLIREWYRLNQAKLCWDPRKVQ